MAQTSKKIDKRPHTWRFFRSGGFDQVKIERGADLLALVDLDQKLWAALTCPAKGLEFDERTLALIDTDSDGRIRAPDVLAALSWAITYLKSPDLLLPGNAALPLSAIDDSTPEGEALLETAKRILVNLGKAGAQEITADDSDDEAEIFASTPFNGDGIVTPDATEDYEVRSVIEDIATCFPEVIDRNGEVGVSRESLAAFFEEAEAFSAWWKRAQDQSEIVLPLGKETPAAAEVLREIRHKIDDYFTRCSLASFDSSSTGPLNPMLGQYEALATKTLSSKNEDVAALVLAHIEPSRPLPLSDGINPAWSKVLDRFKERVVLPLVGVKSRLEFDEWVHVCSVFALYEAWCAEKVGTKVEPLGLERVQSILDGSSRQEIENLIIQDEALEPVAKSIDSVDRLVRYHQHLIRLLRNFVSLRDFYSPECHAIFQVGTLYIDGRSCELCIRVDDVKKHSAIAPLSRTYLIYCDCTRKGTGERMNVACAVTGGDDDNLKVGRNGLFYDRKGRDWDATIIKIIENPISVWQAFWAPYKRFAQLVSDQIQKIIEAKTAKVEKSAAKGLSDVAAGTGASTATAGAPPFDVAKFAGIFAAIGLAIGAIGTAIAAIVTGFLGLDLWQMPLAVLGIPLAISGPSMLIAYLKLRRRNLGPLLDASGWAVNTRAMINIKFGSSLTKTAVLPPGSKRSLKDPFADTTSQWWFWGPILALLLAAGHLWYSGTIDEWISWCRPPAVSVDVTQTKS